MPLPYLVLLLANAVFATSYVASRIVLDEIPPATLALIRLVLGAVILVPLARREGPGARLGAGDRWAIFWMGALGFAGAFAFAHWGILRSTATNAALLIIVEPVALMLLGPALLGERLSRRESAGAALAVAGAVAVVVNGIPGVTESVAPHWRGDLLLVLSGLAYASYSLFGRGVLARLSPLVVTARSIVWGALVMVPFAAAEWSGGQWPALSASAITGALYLAVIITAGGYLTWNWALARVEAARVAIFLNVQPIVGALLGVVLLAEPLTAFTVAGGVMVVAGLWMTVTGRSDGIL